MEKTFLSDFVKYIGVNDRDLDLFESQYIIPNGISYNSYIISDNKTAVLDTVDARKANEWFSNLDNALDGKNPDYLVISHLEPDHSANIKRFADKYPSAKLVLSAKAKNMLPQFFDIENMESRTVVVGENDILDLGDHKLKFIMAPMVHWPEVMLEYELTEKILFSADAFGKFGTIDTDEDWTCEARRYYFNIVGKYGAAVQTLLKKASCLDINTICPLHGPVLKENISYYLEKYNIWSSYKPEDDGVFVACASIHGNTKKAAEKMVEILKEKGISKVAFSDLTRDDMAEAVEDAFRYSKLVLAAASYDGGVFTKMEDFLNRLSHKAYQKRTVGIIENGSWAPSAARTMKNMLDNMKDIDICENIVSIKSVMKQEDIASMEKLADEILN